MIPDERLARSENHPRKTSAYRWLPWCASGLVIVYLFGIGGDGLSTSSDGASYISAARSLLAGEGFESYDGRPFDLWPPLYPMVLAAAAAVSGQDVPNVIRLLHALLWGAGVFVGVRWLMTNVRSQSVLLASAFALVVAKPMIFSFHRVLSEALFVPLTIVLVSVVTWARRENTYTSILSVGAVLAALIVTRYVGVALLIGAAFLLIDRRNSVGVNTIRVGLTAAVALIPIAIWFAYLATTTGSALGHRVESTYSFFEGVWLAMSNIGLFFAPDEIPSVFRFAAGLFLTLGAIVLLSYARRHPEESNPALVPVVLALSFVAFLVTVTSAVASDPPAFRLLLPAYPLIIFGVSAAADHFRLLSRVPAIWTRAASIAVGLVFLYVLLYAGHILRYTRAHGGMSYNHRSWSQLDVIDYVRANTFAGTVYSNHGGVLYLHAGLKSLETPLVYKNSARNSEEAMREFVEGVSRAQQGATLVWIEPPSQPFSDLYVARLATLDEMSEHVEFLLIDSLADARIYHVRVRNES